MVFTSENYSFSIHHELLPTPSWRWHFRDGGNTFRHLRDDGHTFRHFCDGGHTFRHLCDDGHTFRHLRDDGHTFILTFSN